MPISKLNTYYKVKDEKNNLVIIPSGCVVPKPPKEDFNEEKEFKKLKELAQEKVSVILPYDNNIFNGNFSNPSWNTELSHPPRKRAEMIYEAITAQNDDGSYKYNNIYLTGGCNTEDVIFELDKLCKERGPLPVRKDTLKTFGFSDATQLHHYLGQRGISTPVYYSKGVKTLVASLSQEKDIQHQFDLTPLNDMATGMDHIAGYTQPGNQPQVEDKTTHQTKFFDDGYNFLVVEFRSEDLAKDFLETCKKFKDQKIALLVSKDSNKEAMTYLLNYSNFPVFGGMPVGHEGCLQNGEPIPLFANAILEKTDNGYRLNVDNTASDKVKDLSQKPHRPSIKAKGGNENKAILSYLNGSAGAVFDNLDDLQKGGKNLSIIMPKPEKDGDIVQMMEMAVKKLQDKGVIVPEEIEQINFLSDGFTLNPEIKKEIEVRLGDLKERYLPDLKNITLNENDMQFQKQKGLKDLLAEKSMELDIASVEERKALEKAGTLSKKEAKALHDEEQIARLKKRKEMLAQKQ